MHSRERKCVKSRCSALVFHALKTRRESALLKVVQTLGKCSRDFTHPLKKQMHKITQTRKIRKNVEKRTEGRGGRGTYAICSTRQRPPGLGGFSSKLRGFSEVLDNSKHKLLPAPPFLPFVTPLLTRIVSETAPGSML